MIEVVGAVGVVEVVRVVEVVWLVEVVGVVGSQLSESTVAKNCWQRNFITTFKLRDWAYFQTIPFFVK